MTEGPYRQRARNEYEGSDRSLAARPDRIALWAVILAVVAMIAGTASARGESGAVGPGGGTDAAAGGKYDRLWDGYSDKDHRWARHTSECESGGDPKAIGGGGKYRGAFQFLRSTWRAAPKSPGGDPIDYPWKTQAVVAIALKHKEGTGAWPVCG
jgi:Transglycosylase-like domain